MKQDVKMDRNEARMIRQMCRFTMTKKENAQDERTVGSYQLGD